VRSISDGREKPKPVSKKAASTPRQPLHLGRSPELAAFLVRLEQRFLNHVRLVKAPAQVPAAAETVGQATQDAALVFLEPVRFAGIRSHVRVNGADGLDIVASTTLSASESDGLSARKARFFVKGANRESQRVCGRTCRTTV
jgi:hypothetical protein